MVRGFRFGLMLQMAVGPVCLFIFQTAAARGFSLAMTGVLGVVLADALFIFSAIGGVGALMQKNEKITTGIRYAGALILVIFGLSNVLGALGLSPLPSFHWRMRGASAFVNALILTLSNPLSILFWAGVFTTRLTKDGMSRRQAYVFGAGAVLSTAFFLAFAAMLGSAAAAVLNEAIVAVGNGAVGVVLMILGVRTALKAKNPSGYEIDK